MIHKFYQIAHKRVGLPVFMIENKNVVWMNSLAKKLYSTHKDLSEKQFVNWCKSQFSDFEIKNISKSKALVIFKDMKGIERKKIELSSNKSLQSEINSMTSHGHSTMSEEVGLVGISPIIDRLKYLFSTSGISVFLEEVESPLVLNDDHRKAFESVLRVIYNGIKDTKGSHLDIITKAHSNKSVIEFQISQISETKHFFTQSYTSKEMGERSVGDHLERIEQLLSPYRGRFLYFIKDETLVIVVEFQKSRFHHPSVNL